MINELLKAHWLTLTTILSSIVYVLGEHTWLDAFMPVQGEPLIVTLIIVGVLVIEWALKKHKQVMDMFADLKIVIDANALKQEQATLRHRINSIYQSFIDSKDEFITNEFTIRQLTDLQDELTVTSTNSYSQGQMTFMTGKIKLEHNRRRSE